MRAIRLLVLTFLCCVVAVPAWALDDPVTLSGRLEPADVRAGEMAQAVVEVRIDDGWHLYSLTERSGPGPRPTRLSVVEGGPLTAVGDPVQPAPHTELDKGFNIEVEYFAHAVAFSIPVKVNEGLSGAQQAALEIRYQVCKDGACLRPTTKEVPIEFTVAAGTARPDHLEALTAAVTQPEGYEPPSGEGGTTASEPGAPVAATAGAQAASGDDITATIARSKQQGLLAFLGLALSMGFLALLTPCVFPMVPITVSYFTKQQETNPGSGLKGALAYCLGIVGTFTALGLILSVVFSPKAISNLATSPWMNLGLAVLFIVLAFNLFGAFEIIPPAWMVERTQSGTQKGGFIGPMLMGLTFTLTSFTCTFAFVGALLAAATQGDILWPTLGMIAFSTAFASPFFLLALFPGWLAKLPKAGSWLVTVKGYMGFLELAAALKFLSNADLVWEWGFITRPVFLALWFAIFAIGGAYLMGWLRLPHGDGAQVGPFRRVFGAATFGAAVFCLLAINGRSLGQVNGFLPPRVYPGQLETVAEGGIVWLEDYDAAVKQARAENKPLFLDFTGVTCTNCRVMEDTVFPRPEVAEELKKFVTVRLYTDKEDPQSQRYADMQLKRFNQTTLPLYVILSPDEKEIGQSSYTDNVSKFISFLQSGQSRAEQVARNP